MFKLHKNILTKKEQKNLLDFIKIKVEYLGEEWPGLQTKNNLHTYKELEPFLNKIKKYIEPNTIKTCFANYTKGDYIAWHKHDNKYSIVYYLKNSKEIGVMFKKGKNGIEYTKGPENSLLIFDGNKIHSIPNTYEKINRYTIALNII
jgi:hypothetical protein